MTVVGVTGANGWIGEAVCRALAARGVVVRRLVRSTREETDVAWPFSDSAFAIADLAAALEGCTAVIHCAAHVHVPRETAAERRRFTEINVIGTGRVVAACERAGVSRLVFVSSIAVYGAVARTAFAESDLLRPETEYARSKAAAEGIVRASRLDWRIARLATVYGSGDSANFNRLAAAMRRGRFYVPGRGQARKSVITVDRAADVLARLAVADQLPHRIVNVANPAAPSLREICDGFSTVCGFPPAPAIPAALLRLGGGLGDAINRVRPVSPLTRRTVAALTRDTVVACANQQTLFQDLSWSAFSDELRAHAAYYRDAAAGA